jgi:hypothetical protein
MRIAYVSIDEVNQALAARIAAEFGAVVCRVAPKDPAPDGLFDAVLYNIDDVPRDQRSELVERLRRGELDHPTAVHGYDITDEQASSLRQAGVAAAHRLDTGLFYDLLEAARRSRDAVESDGDSTDLTWVNLIK